MDASDVAQIKKDFQMIMEDLNPEDDLRMVTATQALLDQRDEEHNKEIRIARDKLKAQSKVYHAAEEAATRSSNIPTAAQRAQTMAEIDKERMALFKASRAGDAALSRSQDQNRRFREEISGLEQSDVAEEHEVDTTILTLEIIKQLGFEPVLNKDGTLAKVLVRSSSGEAYSHDVQDVDDTSLYDIYEVLWQLAAS